MSLTPDEIKKKKEDLFKEARIGVLGFIQEWGGKSSLANMHSFSEQRYFIAHQSFSHLMESLVSQDLVDFDHVEQIAELTEKGIEYIKAHEKGTS